MKQMGTDTFDKPVRDFLRRRRVVQEVAGGEEAEEGEARQAEVTLDAAHRAPIPG